MANIEKYYTQFHLRRMGIHCYPNEFLVRTMLGKYPRLKLKHDYKDKRILDLGCGDGRNMVLLHNLKMKIFGVEITKEICDAVGRRMKRFGIDADIRVGRNANVPFEDDYFDYILAAASLYYIDKGIPFNSTMCEISRVLRSKGILIATLAHPKTFILKGARELGDGLLEITNDPFKLRNGNVFKVFKSKENIIREFSPSFKNISIGTTIDDYYGLKQDLWLLVAQKK